MQYGQGRPKASGHSAIYSPATICAPSSRPMSIVFLKPSYANEIQRSHAAAISGPRSHSPYSAPSPSGCNTRPRVIPLPFCKLKPHAPFHCRTLARPSPRSHRRAQDGSLLVIDYKTGMSTRATGSFPGPTMCNSLSMRTSPAPRKPEALSSLRSARATSNSPAAPSTPRTFAQWPLGRGTALVKRPLTPDQLGIGSYIEQLARDFFAGRADLDPRDYPKTCDACGLHAICRIHENWLEPSPKRRTSRRMTRPILKPAPPDQAERERALDTSRSILVQAPAGSGKTDLLTRRFLPCSPRSTTPARSSQSPSPKPPQPRCAIASWVNSKRQRPHRTPRTLDEFSMEALARRALERSRTLGWQLIDLPAQLRISTIDSFCRELAIQQPLLSGFGSDLHIDEQPVELYRRAARRVTSKTSERQPRLRAAIENLLLWRDNNWYELEDFSSECSASATVGCTIFSLSHEPDWDALRERLERPLHQPSATLSSVLDSDCSTRCLAHASKRMSWPVSRANKRAGQIHHDLAELAEFPSWSIRHTSATRRRRSAPFVVLPNLSSEKDGAFRQRLDKSHGFPPGSDSRKAALCDLIGTLRRVDGLEDALAAIRNLPPAPLHR